MNKKLFRKNQDKKEINNQNPQNIKQESQNKKKLSNPFFKKKVVNTSFMNQNQTHATPELKKENIQIKKTDTPFNRMNKANEQNSKNKKIAQYTEKFKNLFKKKQPKQNDNTQVKPITPKKKKLGTILIIIAGAMYMVFLGGIIFILILLSDKPELNVNDFISQESSIVYDRNGEIISELGLTIRKNVTYEDLPSSLIDAFVAVEDSRFFEHNGFDLPRFTKAFIENIKTLSFGQGGSTFTMQLVKNTYFVDDEAGKGAAKSIKRKVQEIALAIELENNPSVSKKDIFTAYLNKLYFGGTYQNIRGIQKAAEYYFGKEVNELTLPESAMLAGVVNAPNLYNPYNHMDYAQERRDEVLYLMNYHGYITDEEYEAALKTNVEDLLSDTKSSNNNNGTGTPYQAYIDEVVDEVYELTGLDPYSTTMKIYTAMDKNIQEKMDEIQAEKVDTKYERTASDGTKYFYPDDKWEVASICVDNVTGEIYGILGGRSYSRGGALLLNHATQQKKQPGSSIKPILDYSQAFEVLGWSTSHYITDRPVTYPGTSILIGNSNGTYQGDIPLKHAVYESLNTTAITTLQELIDNKNAGSAYLSNYLNTIGYDVDPTQFNVQYAIGGSSLEVSCLQMAGAQAMLINHGKYNKPHTITKIEFLNDKQPIVYESETVQAISPEAAYLTTELLKFNVSGNVTRDDGSHYANLMELFQDSYQVYAKTGTTNWDSSAKVYGIPNGSIKDGWTIASTSKVTVATWMGYEKAEKDEDGNIYGYIPYSIYNQNIKGKITKMILNKTIESFGQPEEVQRPDGVQSITHITIPGLPYVSPIDGMDERFVTTGLIKKSAYNTVDPQEYSVAQMEGNVDLSISDNVLFITMPAYPNTNSEGSYDGTYDISLYNANGDLLFFSSPIYGKKSFDYAWLFGNVKYMVDLQVNDKTISTNEFETCSGSINILDYLNMGTIRDGDSVKVCAYYGYNDNRMKSNTICSNTVKISDQIHLALNSKWLINDLLQELSKYTTNIITEEDTTSQLDQGVIISITLSDGKELKLGQKYDLSRSSLSGIKIKYSGNKPTPSATIVLNEQEIKVNSNYMATANISNYDGSIKWGYKLANNAEQITSPSDSKTFVFKPDTTGECTITVYTADGTPIGSTTFTVINN